VNLQIAAIEEIEPAGDGLGAALGTNAGRLCGSRHSNIQKPKSEIRSQI
jgi:hypothetical protein